jgi:hypothetical protein
MDALTLCEVFLPMLNPERFINEFMTIGKALHHSCNGSDEGLLLWISYTKLEEKCREVYDTFSGNKITVRTIAYYAYEDNRNLYNQWFLSMIPIDTYKYQSMNHEKLHWYKYQNGKFVKDDK